MIKKSVLILVSILFLIQGLGAIDLGVEIGSSNFNYAEVGINNKDDLYTFNSILFGILLQKSFYGFEFKTSLKAQVPYELKFSDALGQDDTNYLDTLLYFGCNFQCSILYPLVKQSNVVLSIGPILNYDCFYMKDYVVGFSDDYFFSILGLGTGFDINFTINSKINYSLNGNWVYNFLPIGARDGDLLWSYHFMLSTGLIFKF